MYVPLRTKSSLPFGSPAKSAGSALTLSKRKSFNCPSKPKKNKCKNKVNLINGIYNERGLQGTACITFHFTDSYV
jgi:hypothetical protein